MQNVLPSRCGINLILMAYIDAIDDKAECIYSYENGIKWADFLNDLASVIETRTSFKDWIDGLKNTKEWSYFAADDFVPWIISNYETARKILKRTQSALWHKLLASKT